MKSLLKNALPAPVIDLARTIIGRNGSLSTTLFSHYSSGSDSVLPCTIAYNKFGGYCLPLSSRHRPANRKILSGEVWEPDTIEFMSRYCKGGDIVHAGAYFGDFIPALSAACRGLGKVWAFEPNPENYRCAAITIMLNDILNVELANAGLGARKGELSMRVSDDKGRSLGGMSQLMEVESGAADERLVKVAIVKVDDVVPPERKVTILQLDVEGSEEPALLGAIETIRRCKPILILESVPETEWFADNVFGFGYRVSGQLHDNTVLAIE